MLKVVFWQILTFDVLFDVVIFVVVINSFRRCDNLLFDVLINSKDIFDVLKFLACRRSDRRRSDPLPIIHPTANIMRFQKFESQKQVVVLSVNPSKKVLVPIF